VSPSTDWWQAAPQQRQQQQQQQQGMCPLSINNTLTGTQNSSFRARADRQAPYFLHPLLRHCILSTDHAVACACSCCLPAAT
jgi:hypothetical protein